jgi:hypothetical protein
MRMLIETKPGLASFWAEYQHAYEEPFRSYVADAVAAAAKS